ncbi:MAG: sigma-54 dependent transcriptional regulator [Blastocatellia bacterium]
MKSANVLLLNLNPSRELSNSLRSIIESAQNADLRLQQETIDNNDSLSRTESVLPELVSRANPAVIFLVSSWNYLKQAKTLFPSLHRSPPEPPVVIVSDTDAPAEMFEMIKLGAADFITPPLTPTGILPRLWRLIEQTVRGDTLVHKLKEKFFGTKKLLGESPAFLEVVNNIPLIAQYDTTVLISGETGTGKEVCAQAIHRLSTRANRPFIPVNCGAIPIELIENELFGHERGAFTGAASSQMGLIQEADGGTLFLDEIDSLPLMAQVKLLRFPQEKEFRQLGSSKTRRADVRVITATNLDIEKAVNTGKVRQDLYYRLNIIPLKLPPLRERREDILLLAEHFLARCAAKFHKRVTGFDLEARQKLLLHDWPGNVRELEHAVERAAALSSRALIQSSDLALSFGHGGDGLANHVSFKAAKAKVVAEFERTYLQALLMAYNGNVTRAAEAAHKDRGALCQLLRKHRIDANSFRSTVSPEESD